MRLLVRTGKPMHYATIAKLARRLELVESNARHPEVIMSTILSREASDPKSAIRKVRPGVYALSPSVATKTGVADHHRVAARLSALSDRLKCAGPLQALRRALFVLRQCCGAAGQAGTLTLGDGIAEVDLDLQAPGAVRRMRDDLLGVCAENGNAISLDSNLTAGVEELRRQLGLRTIDHVVDLAVSIAEIASRLHSEGRIIVSGQVRSVIIRIESSE